MASEIERFLFGDRGVHAVTSFSLSVGRVVVAVAPWVDLACITEVVFDRATLLSVWADSAEPSEKFALPWDIIAFDSAKQADSQWEFVLCCGSVELIFLANFPQSNNSAVSDETRFID